MRKLLVLLTACFLLSEPAIANNFFAMDTGGGMTQVATGSISAGALKADLATDGYAFAEWGVDLSAYQDGTYYLQITDAAAVVAGGYISAVAPGVETLSDELITNGDMSSSTGWGLVNASIGSGALTITSNGGYGGQSVLVFMGAYYTSFDIITYISGSQGLSSATITNGYYPNSTGTKTRYVTHNGSVVGAARFISTASGGVFDNISFKRLTDCATTGALILTTQAGPTRGWKTIGANFNPNGATTYKVFKISP